jgi:hypothetical protein
VSLPLVEPVVPKDVEPLVTLPVPPAALLVPDAPVATPLAAVALPVEPVLGDCMFAVAPALLPLLGPDEAGAQASEAVERKARKAKRRSFLTRAVTVIDIIVAH